MANPNTINSLHYQDICVSDKAAQTLFKNTWTSGDFSGALSLLNNNNFKGKRFAQDSIDAIVVGLRTLEQRYANDVPMFLENLYLNWTNLIDNFINLGAWNATTAYSEFNFVIYDATVYMALDEVPIGTLPTNTDYWVELGLRGEKGADSIDLNLRFAWNATTNYNVKDLVAFNNQLYVALVSNINAQPDISPSTWQAILTIEQSKIKVVTTLTGEDIEENIVLKTSDDIDLSARVSGELKYYKDNEWHDLSPIIPITAVENGEYLMPSLKHRSVTITGGNWSFLMWADITSADAMVQITPARPLNAVEQRVYNNLSLSIGAGGMTIQAPALANCQFPIDVWLSWNVEGGE